MVDEPHPLDTLTEEERGTLRAARVMEAFKRSDAWAVFVATLESQQEMFRNAALRPASSIEDLARAEYSKGAVFAFGLIMQTPDNILESAAEIRQNLGIGENDE